MNVASRARVHTHTPTRVYCDERTRLWRARRLGEEEDEEKKKTNQAPFRRTTKKKTHRLRKKKQINKQLFKLNPLCRTKNNNKKKQLKSEKKIRNGRCAPRMYVAARQRGRGVNNDPFRFFHPDVFFLNT